MAERRSALRVLANFMLGIWRTRMGKLSAVLVVLGVWRPGFLLIPLGYYAIKLIRTGMRRLLYSVRARLAAFYVYAALLPVLLGLTVLLFMLYVVLGQVSARVVESRLERQVEWAEQHQHLVESTYWRTRAAGSVPRDAMRAALLQTFSDVATPGFACAGLHLLDRAVRGADCSSGRLIVASNGRIRFVNHGAVPEAVWRLLESLHAEGLPGSTTFRTAYRIRRQGEQLNAHDRVPLRRIDVIPLVCHGRFLLRGPSRSLDQDTTG